MFEHFSVQGQGQATVTAAFFNHTASLSGFPWQASRKISAKYALYETNGIIDVKGRSPVVNT